MLNRLNRHDLTDEEWERLRVLLPDGPQQRGGRWADHRTVINGIFFRARAGCPWRDLPEGFGNWKTIYNGQFCRPQVPRLIGYLAVLRATRSAGLTRQGRNGRTGSGLLALAGHTVGYRGQQGDLARRGRE